MVMKRLLVSYVPTSMRLLCTSSYSGPNKLKSGDILNESRVFSNTEVVDYSKLSWDLNPLHLDAECAKNAGFEDVIVPGMLVSSLFPRVIASHFPGAVYASQTLHFKLPVYIGEEITSEVQATSIREMKKKYIAKFSTKCFKRSSLLVIDGEATAILPTLYMEHVQSTA